MAVQQFIYKTTVLMCLGKRIIIVKGAGSVKNQTLAANQVLTDAFGSIKDIFSPFLMIVF